jgi:hypothetical protein
MSDNLTKILLIWHKTPINQSINQLVFLFFFAFYMQICHWGNKKKINMAFHFVQFARINILDQTLNWD